MAELARATANHSLLGAFLSMKLNSLEPEYGGYEPFVAKIGVSKGTYYILRYEKGNPRFETVERIAEQLKMSPYEFLGFTLEEVIEAFHRDGLSYRQAVKEAKKDNIPLVAYALARKLKVLEEAHGGHKNFLNMIGISKGAYYALAHAKGNPTFRTVERIAQGLKMPVYALLGFTEDEATRAYARNGLDYQRLVTEVARRNIPYKEFAPAL